MPVIAARLARDGTVTAWQDGEPIVPQMHEFGWALVSGHIGNQAALTETLGATPDVAALLLRGWDRWGTRLPAMLDGAFAFILHDARHQQLLVGHDVMGVAPMFFADGIDGLLASNDLDFLTRLTAAGDIDRDYIADLLATGYLATARTPFRNLRRLCPGEVLGATRAAARVETIWRLADAPAITEVGRGARVDGLRQRLHDALVTSLCGGRHHWVALSGGLDSSTVAAFAADVPGHAISAWSLTNAEHPASDERPWMAQVVEHLGIPWHPVDAAAVLPFAAAPDHVPAEPSGSVFGTAQARHLRAAMTQAGVTSLLTGDGGDAQFGTFGGPIPVHLADPLWQGRPWQCWHQIRQWQAARPDRRPLRYWLSRGIVAPSLAHRNRRQVRNDEPLPLPDWLDGPAIGDLDLPERETRSPAPRCATPGQQAIADALWFAAHSRALAAGSRVPMRLPLLDRRLSEYLFAMPWPEKLSPQADRLLLRRALKDRVPDAVRRRAGKAIGTWPFVTGLARARGWQAFLASDPYVTQLGLVTTAAWQRAIHQAALGQTQGDRFFLTMAALEAWLKLRAGRRPDCP